MESGARISSGVLQAGKYRLHISSVHGSGQSFKVPQPRRPAAEKTSNPVPEIRATRRLSDRRVRVQDAFVNAVAEFGSMAELQSISCIDRLQNANLATPNLSQDALSNATKHISSSALRMAKVLQLKDVLTLQSSYVLLMTQVFRALCELSAREQQVAEVPAGALLQAAITLEDQLGQRSTFAYAPAPTSPRLLTETPVGMDGLFGGRAELQVYQTVDGQHIIAGLVEVGRGLHYQTWEQRMQQLMKELLTASAMNALKNHYQPVWGILTDGLDVVKVTFTSTCSSYSNKMEREKLTGKFRCTEGASLWDANFAYMHSTPKAIAILLSTINEFSEVVDEKVLQQRIDTAAQRVTTRIDNFVESAIRLHSRKRQHG